MAEKKIYKNPEDYINQQPKDRIDALKKIRQIINNSLPKGFEETTQHEYNMIGYVVPKSIYPPGYHVTPKEPLPFLALANQKHFIALYHLGIYANSELLEWFQNAYQELDIGKLDMGKSCIRFNNINKIPYDLIGELCSKVSVEDYIKIYEENILRKTK
jgi:hypothetical protein